MSLFLILLWWIHLRVRAVSRLLQQFKRYLILQQEDKTLEELSAAKKGRQYLIKQIATIGAAAAIGTTFQIVGAL